MKQIVAILLMAALSRVSAQFINPETIGYGQAEPYDHFGSEIQFVEPYLFVISENEDLGKHAVHIFEETENELVWLQTFSEQDGVDAIGLSKGTMAYSDSLFLFFTTTRDNIWGDRKEKLNLFRLTEGGVWVFDKINLTNFYRANICDGCWNCNGCGFRVTSARLTDYGLFLDSDYGCSTLYDGYWRVSGLENPETMMIEPLCGFIPKYSSKIAFNDSLLLRKANSNEILQLQYESPEEWILMPVWDIEFDDPQSGIFTDFETVNYSTYGFVSSYADYFQDADPVYTILAVNMADVDSLTEGEYFNFSTEFNTVNDLPGGFWRTSISGSCILFECAHPFCVSIDENGVSWIGFVQDGLSEPNGLESSTIGNHFVFISLPFSEEFGVESGKVLAFPKIDNELIQGCTNQDACNYSANAVIDNNTCTYPDIYQCDGTCFNDNDGDGICDELDDTPFGCYGPDCCGPGTVWDPSGYRCIGYNSCPRDINSDGAVTLNDLLDLLAGYGLSCQ